MKNDSVTKKINTFYELAEHKSKSKNTSVSAAIIATIFAFVLPVCSLFAAFNLNSFGAVKFFEEGGTGGASVAGGAAVVYAEMPFYDLRPQKIVKRAEFYTSYTTSSPERKNNISVAAKALNNTFIDVGGEFSFNGTVGARTEARGYKKAKIIVGGKFVDGVGGGVCQVSTTLYNAVLLSGLKITEYHSHSLPVSYIAPSFDAMVNSGSADLRFINDTHNPVIIKTTTSESAIRITVYGEPMKEKFVRKSVITDKIAAPAEEVVADENGEFPELYEGERKVVSYSKEGYKSEGYLIKLIDGAPVASIKIRSDTYASLKGKIVEGRAKRPEGSDEENSFGISEVAGFGIENGGGDINDISGFYHYAESDEKVGAVRKYLPIRQFGAR